MIKFIAILSILCGACFGVTMTVTMEANETRPTIYVPLLVAGDDAVTGLNNTTIDWWYTKPLAAEVAVTGPAALAAVTTEWTPDSVIEIGHGVYRIDLAAAAVAGGVGTQVMVCVSGTGAKNTYVTIQLTPPTNAVRLMGSVPLDNTYDTMRSNVIYVNGVTPATVATTADAVWNSLVASYVTSGTFGLITGSGAVPPPSGPYTYRLGKEDPARVSTATTLYYPMADPDHVYMMAGSILAVKTATGFYEKAVIGSCNAGTNTVIFSIPLLAPPADGQDFYIVETPKGAEWWKSLIRSVLNSNSVAK